MAPAPLFAGTVLATQSGLQPHVDGVGQKTHMDIPHTHTCEQAIVIYAPIEVCPGVWGNLPGVPTSWKVRNIEQNHPKLIDWPISNYE